MRHDPGLAASPPVRYILEVERRVPTPFHLPSAVDGQPPREAAARGVRRYRQPRRISCGERVASAPRLFGSSTRRRRDPVLDRDDFDCEAWGCARYGEYHTAGTDHNPQEGADHGMANAKTDAKAGRDASGHQSHSPY